MLDYGVRHKIGGKLVASQSSPRSRPVLWSLRDNESSSNECIQDLMKLSVKPWGVFGSNLGTQGVPDWTRLPADTPHALRKATATVRDERSETTRGTPASPQPADDLSRSKPSRVWRGSWGVPLWPFLLPGSYDPYPMPNFVRMEPGASPVRSSPLSKQQAAAISENPHCTTVALLARRFRLSL